MNEGKSGQMNEITMEHLSQIGRGNFSLFQWVMDGSMRQH